MGAIEFGTVISAVGEPGASDETQYAEALADADHVAKLGYDALWVIEHHFSDYFPTPSPTVMLSHLAGRLPDMDLGTCVVVLPWYSPLRLAEEISMLSQLSRGTLHIGFGRGLARLEYDAYGIDMGESRARFRECHEVIGKALGGAPFTHTGRFFAIDRPIELRPKPVLERVKLYGATSSPETALIMAEIGLPMIRVSNFPLPYHITDFESWDNETRKHGRSTDVARPILIHAVLADTDAEALALARTHLSRYFEKVVEHYEADADPWKEFEDYKAFSKFMATAKKLTDPENMGPWLELQLIGSAETVRRQLQAYVDLGFDHFILQNATYGMPRAYRHEMWERFARDVAPWFADAEDCLEASRRHGGSRRAHRA